MTLRTQVAGGLLLLLLLSSGLALYQLLLARQLHEANRRLVGADLEVSRSCLRIQRHVDRLSGLTQRYAVLADAAYVGELEASSHGVRREIGHLQELPLVDQGPVEALGGLWEEADRHLEGLPGAVGSGVGVDSGLAAVLESLAALRDQTLRMDISILIRTVGHVLMRRGISHDDHATMPEYLGPDQEQDSD